jgi:hypothetical protein
LPLFIDVTELREAQKTSKRKLEEYQIAEEDEGEDEDIQDDTDEEDDDQGNVSEEGGSQGPPKRSKIF